VCYPTLSIISANSAVDATIIVPTGGDFQAAVDIASFGDTIVLQAGATFVAWQEGAVGRFKGMATPGSTSESSGAGSRLIHPSWVGWVCSPYRP